MYDIFDIGIDWIPDRERLIEDLIRKHLSCRVHYRINNINVFDSAKWTSNLVDHLEDVLVEKYPNIQFTGERQEWAYISNKKWSPAYWHNHIPRGRTEDHWYNKHLSTVFYIRNPGGALGIVDEDNNKNVIMPKDGQFVIFPLHTVHSPLPYCGEEYRIALNVNFYTKNTYSDFLNISNQSG